MVPQFWGTGKMEKACSSGSRKTMGNDNNPLFNIEKLINTKNSKYIYYYR